ncbi:flagellar assembly protein FliW [Pseudogracilibacillus sp. ICA-222130]|uniref:flagellar assembly protein FliW n=1 Tax=Pseudogracilibacillus sp. ICA-222130 TaxID=3134655 RepID=UPI0030C269E3
MKIKTKYLNEVVIEEEKIIHFEQGIPGFQEEKNFALLDLPNNDLLQILQSIETKEIAFIVTNPHIFYPAYEFTLEDYVVDALHIEKEKDIAILTIMTIHEPFAKSTINLKAPIIINTRNKKGKQFILNDETFKMKAAISNSFNHKGGEAEC